jgi:hypothetical protein
VNYINKALAADQDFSRFAKTVEPGAAMYCDASPTCDVRPDETFTRKALQMGREALIILGAAQTELDELLSRNLGPGPTSAGGAGEGKMPSSRFGELDALLHEILARADRLTSAARTANSTH